MVSRFVISSKFTVSTLESESRYTQRGAQRCVQTARTTTVDRSHTMSIQVAHECACAQCSQTHRCLQTGLGASFSSVNVGMLFTNRVGPSYAEVTSPVGVVQAKPSVLNRTVVTRQWRCHRDGARASRESREGAG